MAARVCDLCGVATNGRMIIHDYHKYHPKCYEREKETIAMYNEQPILCPECLHYIMSSHARESVHGLVFHRDCAIKAKNHDLSHLDDDKDTILVEIIELGPANEEIMPAIEELRQIEKAMSEQPNTELLLQDGWNQHQIAGLISYREQILHAAFKSVFIPGDHGTGYNPS